MDAAAPMQLLSQDARSRARGLLLDYLRIAPDSRVLFLRLPLLAELANALAEIARGEGIDCEVVASNGDFASVGPTFESFDTIVYLERPGIPTPNSLKSNHKPEVFAWLKSRPTPRTRVFRVFDFSHDLLDER